MAEQLVLRGTLEGHSGWVTSLATSAEKYDFAKHMSEERYTDIQKPQHAPVRLPRQVPHHLELDPR